MNKAAKLIDEMKDPLVRVLEALNERITMTENQIDAMLTVKDETSTVGELELIAATIGRMSEAMGAMKTKIDELEKWSNVHTHAQSEELKYKGFTKKERIAMGRELGNVQGKFCLQCHKVLKPERRNQRIFCSPMHASRWYKENPGVKPYPLMKLHAGGFETKVTAGEAVESEAYAART